MVSGLVRLQGKIRKALENSSSREKKRETRVCRHCGEEFKLSESLKMHRLSNHH